MNRTTSSGPAIASSRRPRVLVLATTLPGEPGDGTPEFVLTLARNVCPESTVIVAPRVRGCAKRQKVDGIELRRFAYAPKRLERLGDDAILPTLKATPSLIYQLPLLFLALAAAAFAEARRSRPDVIHAHWVLPAGLIGAVIGRLTNTPLVVTAHGADAYAINGRVSRILKRWVLDQATAVYPVSQEIGDRLDQLSPGCVSKVLPMGVDVERIRGAVGQRHPHRRQLLFVGRLVQKKGVDILLEALAEITETIPLRIAGDGPDRAQLEAQVRRLGLDSVTFLGHCTADEVAAEYARAAAVVIPSRTADNGDRDGTPVVLMEAMALGIPIVASALGGIADHIRSPQDATLVPEADISSLAAAIREILADPVGADERAARLARQTAHNIDVAHVGHTLAGDFSAISRQRVRSPTESAA